MFFIDLRAAGSSQISDKHQHYGLAVLPDGAAPVHFAQEVHFAQQVHFAQENRLLA